MSSSARLKRLPLGEGGWPKARRMRVSTGRGFALRTAPPSRGSYILWGAVSRTRPYTTSFCGARRPRHAKPRRGAPVCAPAGMAATPPYGHVGAATCRPQTSAVPRWAGGHRPPLPTSSWAKRRTRLSCPFLRRQGLGEQILRLRLRMTENVWARRGRRAPHKSSPIPTHFPPEKNHPPAAVPPGDADGAYTVSREARSYPVRPARGSADGGHFGPPASPTGLSPCGDPAFHYICSGGMNPPGIKVLACGQNAWQGGDGISFTPTLLSGSARCRRRRIAPPPQGCRQPQWYRRRRPPRGPGR